MKKFIGPIAFMVFLVFVVIVFIIREIELANLLAVSPEKDPETQWFRDIMKSPCNDATDDDKKFFMSMYGIYITKGMDRELAFYKAMNDVYVFRAGFEPIK